ncbi:MAG: hypothetical protein LUG83_04270, partial [Lachnospiraceae bacterium]|nr:hypothetical protein [Lachnospiraceae bacterium]
MKPKPMFHEKAASHSLQMSKWLPKQLQESKRTEFFHGYNGNRLLQSKAGAIKKLWHSGSRLLRVFLSANKMPLWSSRSRDMAPRLKLPRDRLYKKSFGSNEINCQKKQCRAAASDIFFQAALCIRLSLHKQTPQRIVIWLLFYT